jgi:hypothetical protein
MMCDRCHKPIREGQAYDTIPIISPSGPGTTVTLHKRLCQKPPTQTASVDPLGRAGR